MGISGFYSISVLSVGNFPIHWQRMLWAGIYKKWVEAKYYKNDMTSRTKTWTSAPTSEYATI